jgi:hypothetical protein
MTKKGEKVKDSNRISEPSHKDNFPSYKSYEELRSSILTSVGSHQKALTLEHNLHLLDTEDQKKTALEFLEDCLRNEDGAAKKDVLRIRKAVQDLNTMKSGQWTIFFREPKVIIPALDIMPDGTLILTVPFPGERTETDRKGNTRTRRDLVNFVITSTLEVFECSEAEFAKREIFAKVPDSVLRSRWPMKSRKELMTGNFHRDPYQVFKKITAAFEKYIDFGDNRGAAVFCSIYGILTYFFILFDSIPYLKFEGMKGSGKSKAGTIYSYIGFNAVMAVSMTAASIFRIVQDERATLIMDETENFKSDSDKFQDIMPILNSGWQKTGNAPRVEGNSGNRKTVSYSTYSPKIFCSINPVLETLRDRSYVINLIKTLDGTKANLSPREKDPIWADIRSDLYLLLFEYYEEVKELAESEEIANDLKLIGRDWDKAKPIITLAQFISKYAGEEGETIRSDLIEFLKQQRQEEEEIAENSIEYTIIRVLEERISEGLEALIPEKRTRDVPVTVQLLDFSLQVATLEGLDTASSRFNKPSYSRKIGRKLKSMGLKRNSRITHGNFAVFDCTMRDIEVAKQRYKMDSQNLPNHPNQPNLPNPPNHPNLPNPNHYPNHPENEENGQDVRKVREVGINLTDMEKLQGKIKEDPVKNNISIEKTVENMILDILTRLQSTVRESRIDPDMVIDAWSSTSGIPCPSRNDLYSRILPTMSAEGLIHMANGLIELPGEGRL